MVKLHSSRPRPTVDLSLGPEFPPMGTLGVLLTPIPEGSVSLLKGGVLLPGQSLPKQLPGQNLPLPPLDAPPPAVSWRGAGGNSSSSTSSSG